MGNKIYGGESSHLPLKINTAGVIPAIFADWDSFGLEFGSNERFIVVLPTTTFAKTSLALFNLSPASIDAIGLDGDLLFSMRKELERSQTYQLLSRRQMEEGLYRIGGAQVADTQKIIQYGN